MVSLFELMQGAYGIVVLANDSKLLKQVALKVIDKNAIKNRGQLNRLRREINILRLLDHPNIVKLYDIVVSSHFINVKGNSQ